MSYLFMNSIERAATLTLPYLSALVLGMAMWNCERKQNRNWNSLKSKINLPNRVGYIQTSPNALQVLINLQHPCEMDMYFCPYHFIHAAGWADLQRAEWQSNPVVQVRWEQSQPSTGLTDQGDLKTLVMKNRDGEKNIFSWPECITPSAMLAALHCQGSSRCGEED